MALKRSAPIGGTHRHTSGATPQCPLQNHHYICADLESDNLKGLGLTVFLLHVVFLFVGLVGCLIAQSVRLRIVLLCVGSPLRLFVCLFVCLHIVLSVQFSSGIYALGNAHMSSAPSFRSLCSVVLEMIPMLVWLKMVLSQPLIVNQRPLPFRTPLSCRRSML